MSMQRGNVVALLTIFHELRYVVAKDLASATQLKWMSQLAEPVTMTFEIGESADTDSIH